MAKKAKKAKSKTKKSKKKAAPARKKKRAAVKTKKKEDPHFDKKEAFKNPEEIGTFELEGDKVQVVRADGGYFVIIYGKHYYAGETKEIKNTFVRVLKGFFNKEKISKN